MLYIPYPFKRCTTCDTEYFATTKYFRKRKNTLDGLRYCCKQCDLIKDERYRTAHPEQVHESKKRWREENWEQKRASDERYRKENAQVVYDRSRQYARFHPDKILKAAKKFRDNNPDKVRRGYQTYRARKKALPATFKNRDWEFALHYWHGSCAYCGNPPRLWDNPRVLQQDHFIAAINGGGYTPDNILPCCAACNKNKSDKDAERWLIERLGKRKAKLLLARIRDFFVAAIEHHQNVLEA